MGYPTKIVRGSLQRGYPTKIVRVRNKEVWGSCANKRIGFGERRFNSKNVRSVHVKYLHIPHQDVARGALGCRRLRPGGNREKRVRRTAREILKPESGSYCRLTARRVIGRTGDSIFLELKKTPPYGTAHWRECLKEDDGDDSGTTSFCVSIDRAVLKPRHSTRASASEPPPVPPLLRHLAMTFTRSGLKQLPLVRGLLEAVGAAVRLWPLSASRQGPPICGTQLC